MIHSGENPFKCEFCPKSFKQIANLKSHHRVHTGEKPFQCQICHKHFRHSTTHARHLMIHTGENPFPCEFCPKRFKQLVNLKRHHRVHTGEKPFQYKLCHKHFGYLSGLHRHLKLSKSHAETIAKAESSESGDSCIAEDTALEALDTAATAETCTDEDEMPLPRAMTEISKGTTKELNEPPKLSATEYQCEHCSKVCKSASGFTKHQTSHFAHTCRFCGKVFCSTDTLQDHLSEIHPDQLEKLPFSCRYCSMCFPTELALQGHVESSHSTSTTKYMCEWCGRSVQKYYLPEHYRIHQQVPHECKLCGKVFKAPTYLKRHIRRCHKH